MPGWPMLTGSCRRSVRSSGDNTNTYREPGVVTFDPHAAWQSGGQPPPQWQPAGQPQYGPPAPPVAPPGGYPPVPPAGFPPPGPGFLPPAPPPRRRKNLVPLIIGGVAAITALACCLGVTLSGGTSNTTTADNAPAVPATTAAAAPAAAGPTQSLRAAILAWWSAGGHDRAQKLADDFSQLQAATGSGNQIAAVHQACTHLQTDVESAQAYGQIPDAAAQTSWAKALALFARGAADCLAGTEQVDAALITKAGNEISQGSDAMNQVTARIGQLS